MNDRLPGTTYYNPIWYAPEGYRARWRIYINTDVVDPLHLPYTFVHDDYDGAEDAGDWRYGWGTSVEDCKEQINDWVMDNEEYMAYDRLI